VSGSDSRISLWDLDKNQVFRFPDQQNGISRAIAFSPEGTILVVGRDNGYLEFFDTKTGLLRAKYKGHTSTIHSLAFSPDGRTLATGGADQIIKFWHFPTDSIGMTFSKRAGAVRCLEFSPDGKTLIVAGEMNSVELWDIEKEQLRTVLEGQSGLIYSVALTADGQMLAVGGSNSTITVWDLETGVVEHLLDKHDDWIVSLAYSPDGMNLIAIDDDEVIKMWDVSNGNVKLKLKGRVDFQWNPGSAFTEKECDAVFNWVWSGGGLLLLTDHAPWGASAENLASRFSVSLSNSNGTEDSIHHDSDGNYGFLVFSKKNGLLGDHAIIQGRHSGESVNQIVTYYGNSLMGPEESTSLLTLSSTSFDIFKDNNRLPAKGRSQGVAGAYGKGRVVILGEMGMFMADATNLDGSHTEIGLNRTDYDNRQFAINTIRWLAREN
jgi:WD40 repeat protein